LRLEVVSLVFIEQEKEGREERKCSPDGTVVSGTFKKGKEGKKEKTG